MNIKLTVACGLATVAASFALLPLVSGGGWFWAGVGAVIVAAAVGAASRVRAIPAIICLVAVLAAEFLYLNAAFAGSQSRYLVIPTGKSLAHLTGLVSHAMSQVAKYAPPVPASASISLITAAGIALIAATTDLVAVRLHRPALAGLPLLVLFCVPLTTSANPRWPETTLIFCLGVAGYLGLLSTDGRERLRLWGHIVHTRHGDPDEQGPDTRLLGVAGRRLGFTAMALALCVPLLVPGLKHHPLFGKGGPGHAHSARLTLPEPLIQLNRQLHEPRPQTVLTYHTTSQDPPYLQVYVLNQLNPNTWALTVPRKTVVLGSGPLPAVPGLSRSTTTITVHETITLGNALTPGRTTLAYLPLPYAPRWVHVSGTWRVDQDSLGVLTAGTKLGGLRYAVTSQDVAPSPQRLREAQGADARAALYVGYPEAFGKLQRLAGRITAGQATAYDKAVALQDWFTRPGNFTYDLNTPEPRTPGALIRFLTRTKRGYCQQFAFGMAVLARVLNIPSRVVVGYTQGAPIGRDTWRVTTQDAHAWPELYFPGAGWLRFEPTPSASRGRAGQPTATAPLYTHSDLSTVGQEPHPTPSASATTPGRVGNVRANGGQLSKLRRLASDAGGAAGASGRKRHSPFPAGPVILAMLGLLAVAPGATRPVVRRLRWLRASGNAGHAHAAWRALRDDLADHRMSSRPSETPRALARRLRAELRLSPVEADALDRIVHAEERARYAAAPAKSSRLQADVATVRGAIARACRLPGRCAALVAPASVLIPVRDSLSAALDAFAWVDALGAWARSRSRRRRNGSRHTWRR